MASSQEQLGFCIVGCGMIARFRWALAEVPGPIDRRWFRDLRRAREAMIKELALPDVAVYNDLATALHPEIDVVVITTPSGAIWSPPLPPRRRASMSSSRSPWRSPPTAATASSTPATQSGSALHHLSFPLWRCQLAAEAASRRAALAG